MAITTITTTTNQTNQDRFPKFSILSQPDIIREIFEQCDFKDLKEVRLVNGAWNRVSSELIFKQLKLNSEFICYQNVQSNCKMLHWSDCKLNCYLNHLDQVNELNAEGPITKNRWNQIEKFKNLRKLKFYRCSNADEMDFDKVDLNGLFTLDKLDVEYCQYHFSMHLPRYSTHLFNVRHLVSLTLTRVPSGMHDQFIQLILDNPQLTELSLKLHRFDVESISKICRKLTKLRTLIFLPFKNAHLLTPSEEDTIHEFGNWCHCSNNIHFSSFNFYKYDFTNDWSSSLCDLFQSNPNLNYLELSDLPLDHTCLLQLTQLHQLKHLSLINCKVHSVHLVKVFQSCVQLKHCELSMVEGIDDTVIESLMKYCTKLTTLKLEWVCVSHSGVEFIRQYGSQLTFLELNLRYDFYLKQFELDWQCRNQLKTLILENIHACDLNQLGVKQFNHLVILYLRCKESISGLKEKLMIELPNTKVY